MPNNRDTGRNDLRNWQEQQPDNFFTSNQHLRRLLRTFWGDADYAKREPHLKHFGSVAATGLDEAAIINNRVGNLPRLERWSSIGERIESIEHHPSFDACGQAIYEEGRVIAVYGEPASNLYAQTLFYLSSHAGEAGHNCPVACTAGVVKTLQHAAGDELRNRWLPGVLTHTWPDRLDGAQFLTEVQGGSDVGANCVEATPDGEAFGTTRWKINGEKWFCSNANADLILMTARYDNATSGTRGLGLFLVPRKLEDGTVNHYAIRRLKDKLGTRSMASGEIDFNGAVAYAVGSVDEGFTTVMRWVINTSRLYNTVGCTGMSRRAYEVASGYAQHRRAFKHPIIEYPLVQEMLANMRATEAALLAGSMTLAHRFDLAESGKLSDDEIGFLRVATNLCKMRSCQHSHRIILTGIETLGGNGAIETFSVLPRLLRDNVVYENWEGTHNTLVAQTLRDFSKPSLQQGFISGLKKLLDLPQHSDLQPALNRLTESVQGLEEGIAAALASTSAGVGALILRPHLEAAADIYLAATYAHDIATETDAERRSQDVAMLNWFMTHNLTLSAQRRDQAYAAAAAQVVGT